MTTTTNKKPAKATKSTKETVVANAAANEEAINTNEVLATATPVTETNETNETIAPVDDVLANTTPAATVPETIVPETIVPETIVPAVVADTQTQLDTNAAVTANVVAVVNKAEIGRKIFAEELATGTLVRKNVINRLVAEAGLTKKGAATYYQGMKKKAGLVNSPVVVTVATPAATTTPIADAVTGDEAVAA